MNKEPQSGKYFVSTKPLDKEVIYYFTGNNRSGIVKYDKLHTAASQVDNLCLRGASKNPEFTPTMPYMSYCSVDVSCDLIENIDDSNSTTFTLNIYRISSTAKCDVGRFSTERTIYVDAKTL
jgi:hypothetical protein